MRQEQAYHLAEQFDPKERILKRSFPAQATGTPDAEQFDPKERILKPVQAH